MSSPAQSPLMTEQTAQKLLEAVLNVQIDVKLIKARQDEDNRRLFGNGQPGELAQMKERIDKSHDWIVAADARDKTNRKWTALIATAFGTIAGAAVDWLFKRH